MLETKCAVVTGAASGIGLEVVRRLERDPKYSPIYAIDKNPEIFATFSSSLYPRVRTMQVDIRLGNENALMFDRIRKEAQRLDLLVNCAGTIIAGDDVSPEASARIRDLNFEEMSLAASKGISTLKRGAFAPTS